MRVTKTRLAAAIVAMAVAIPAAASGAGLFDDVPGGAFYATSVDWAAENGITTGKTATSFAPDDAVTRGEVVTFLKRYNDNVVEAALTDLASEIDVLEAAIAPLTNSVAAFAGGDTTDALTGSAATYQTLSIMPPADGIVIVTASATAENTSGTESIARCSIHTGGPIDFGYLISGTTTATDQLTQLAGTRGYTVTEGTLLTVNLNCDQASGSSNLLDATLTAVFAPS